MRLLVLAASDVREALGYADCAAAMREILAARARGEVFQPLRSVYAPPGAAGRMALMPAYSGGEDGSFALKSLCLMPDNPPERDSHQGVVVLSHSDTGEPLAVLNASAVTEIRTAAVSALATEFLARPGADSLAIIGTGVQARAHLRAIAASRPLREARIAGRTPDRAAAFAAVAEPPGSPAAGVTIIATASAEEALAGAGIVVTATSSAEPVLRREWLAPGAHVNAVGACLPHLREIDTATMITAALFADSRQSMLAEAGDYLIPAAAGELGPDQIRAELGDLIIGAPGAPGAVGRSDPAEITLFESLGLAIEDLAAGFAAYRVARRRGLGELVEF